MTEIRLRTDEHVGVEGNYSIDRLATANGVRWYGHVLRRDDDSVLRVVLDIKSERQEKASTTKEDLEEASGGEDREGWFEKRGCPETRQVEGPSASNCKRNGVNPAISAKVTTPDKNRITTKRCHSSSACWREWKGGQINRIGLLLLVNFENFICLTFYQMTVNSAQ